MNKRINFPQLNPKTVNALRDMAVEIESNDVGVAKELMHLAYLARPNGSFIKKKLDGYDKILNSPSDLRLREMLSSGELAIIPVGFRCYTKMKLAKSLGLNQPSLPFDSGFFPPASVASVIESQKISLNFESSGSNHAVCIKHADHFDPVYGRGLKFEKSTYQEIDARVVSRNMDNINQYLDSSHGYYTLDLHHNFVLAHYNWHVFADYKYSKGIYDIKTNINKINNILNRRIARMFDICHAAKYILFVFSEHQNCNYMAINDKYIDLNNLDVITRAIENKFTATSLVVEFNDINSSKKILEMLK